MEVTYTPSSALVFPKNIHEFIQYFFRPYRVYFLLMVLVCIIASFGITLTPYVLKIFLDAATNLIGKEGFIEGVIIPVFLLIGIDILMNLTWRFNNYLYLKSLPRLKADIIDRASNYVHYHSYQFFQDNLSGAVANKILNLAENTEALIYAFTGTGMILQIITIFSAIAISSIVSPWFSLLFLVSTIIFIKLAYVFSKGIEPYAKRFAESRSHSMGNVVDSFSNALNVILFAREKYEKKFLENSLNEMVKDDKALQKKLMRYAFVMSAASISMRALTMVLLVYLGSKGILTIGDFVLIFMLAISIMEQIWNFTERGFKIADELGVFNQALEFISLKPDIIDSPNAKPIKVDSGTIVFSRVQFFYTGTQRLFEDKTLVISGKEKVGLVGYSGSGKSTFVNLITRMFDVQKGDILIDDQSIRTVTLHSLRESISFIPQDPTLFHRSLMDNIRFGKIEASEEEIIEAAKKAHVHEFAMELESQYNTLVGERGVKLSGGQRQRIAIARAILKNAPILILDEATSALDSKTESLIQESLKIAMKNKTVIVIAHRLSTIKSMDRILVFDQGRVVEEGNHKYLLEKGKIYKDLWQKQQGFL